MVSEVVSCSVLNSIPTLIPGVEQVLLVHFEEESALPSGFILNRSEHDYIPDKVQISGTQTFFTNLLKDSKATQWFQKNQLPFEITAKDKVQLTIFSELKNNILLIRQRDDISQSADLIFIYFNENLSNFLIEKADIPFSTQNKAIVAYLLSQSVKALYTLFRQNSQTLELFSGQLTEIIAERNTLREELENFHAKNRLNLVKIAQHHLNNISRETGMKLSLSDSARLKLREYEGEIQDLERVIRDAVQFAGKIQPSPVHREILIADYHIRFPSLPAFKPPEIISDGLTERFIRTHQLLDRIEHAALALRQKKMALTSANVGKELPTPISAPAISDALKKHRKRITQLFEKYPDKWEIIRHNFRPIQNILTEKDEKEQLSA